eukprot:GILI01016128.1.p1 GENE.GILI01016128.1~~GILI01016128.1.p1  ORF type:complete len:677 (+),score=162.27 GILI01016128.1:49-2031(+)
MNKGVGLGETGEWELTQQPSQPFLLSPRSGKVVDFDDLDQLKVEMEQNVADRIISSLIKVYQEHLKREARANLRSLQDFQSQFETEVVSLIRSLEHKYITLIHKCQAFRPIKMQFAQLQKAHKELQSKYQQLRSTYKHVKGELLDYKDLLQSERHNYAQLKHQLSSATSSSHPPSHRNSAAVPAFVPPKSFEEEYFEMLALQTKEKYAVKLREMVTDYEVQRMRQLKLAKELQKKEAIVEDAIDSGMGLRQLEEAIKNVRVSPKEVEDLAKLKPKCVSVSVQTNPVAFADDKKKRRKKDDSDDDLAKLKSKSAEEAPPTPPVPAKPAATPSALQLAMDDLQRKEEELRRERERISTERLEEKWMNQYLANEIQRWKQKSAELQIALARSVDKLQEAIQFTLSIHDKMKPDLSCPQCFEFYSGPSYTLHPCSHQLCHHCLALATDKTASNEIDCPECDGASKPVDAVVRNYGLENVCSKFAWWQVPLDSMQKLLLEVQSAVTRTMEETQKSVRSSKFMSVLSATVLLSGTGGSSMVSLFARRIQTAWRKIRTLKDAAGRGDATSFSTLQGLYVRNNTNSNGNSNSNNGGGDSTNSNGNSNSNVNSSSSGNGPGAPKLSHSSSLSAAAPVSTPPTNSKAVANSGPPSTAKGGARRETKVIKK